MVRAVVTSSRRREPFKHQNNGRGQGNRVEPEGRTSLRAEAGGRPNSDHGRENGIGR